jgi:hypothetical protein
MQQLQDPPVGGLVELEVDRPHVIVTGPRSWVQLLLARPRRFGPASRLQDELLNIEEFGSIAEAKVVIEDRRQEYNNYRPHSALGGRCPSEYAITTKKNNQNKQPRTRIAPGLTTGPNHCFLVVTCKGV